MIRQENERIMITLTKKQVKWLKQQSKRLGISVSRFVKWCIDRNLAKVLHEYMTEDQLKTMVRIAKAPWINFSDEEINAAAIKAKDEDFNPFPGIEL